MKKINNNSNAMRNVRHIVLWCKYGYFALDWRQSYVKKSNHLSSVFFLIFLYMENVKTNDGPIHFWLGNVCACDKFEMILLRGSLWNHSIFCHNSDITSSNKLLSILIIDSTWIRCLTSILFCSSFKRNS